MQIADGLTTHTIVVCVDKRERSIPLQTILTKMGYRVITCLCLYDALKVIAQEMPHLVVSEALLSDGNAGTLYDRLHQNQLLKKTPLLVNVLNKANKAELLPLKGRKFAGILVGQLEPKTFASKVKEIFGNSKDVSPYFVAVDDLSFDKQLAITLDATVVGTSNGQVVSKSQTEVDPVASLVCVPENGKLSPVLVKMGSNLRSGDEIFNLFPVSRVKGKGRKWIADLPDINVGESQASSDTHKVLFYEPNRERFQQFKQILGGYNIDLVHAASLQQAAAIFKRDHESLDCAYLMEMVTDSSSIVWKEAYGSVADAKRPPVIIGTSSQKARSTPQVRYILKPFGIGVLVETLEAAFERGEDVAANAEKGSAGISISYQAPAKLVGLDESGGIIQLSFPIIKGSRVSLDHPELKNAWDGDSSVLITKSATFPDRPDQWQARFDFVAAGTSKAKYWGKMMKFLDEKKTAA